MLSPVASVLSSFGTQLNRNSTETLAEVEDRVLKYHNEGSSFDPVSCDGGPAPRPNRVGGRE